MVIQPAIHITHRSFSYPFSLALAHAVPKLKNIPIRFTKQNQNLEVGSRKLSHPEIIRKLSRVYIFMEYTENYNYFLKKFSDSL